MPVTPAYIFTLALERHRRPWNWTLHCAAVCLFGLALLFHSYLTLAASFIFLGTGFFDLDVPVSKNRWFAFTRQCIEWEKNWVAAPWNWRKWWRFILFAFFTAIAIRALWAADLAMLLIFPAMGYLLHVMRQNKDLGIDP